MDEFIKYGYSLRSVDVFTKPGYFHKDGSFSLRSMKRREGVFLPKAQKWYVYKVSCITKKLITNNLLDSKIYTSNITALSQ
jgi:hypothetical protein